MSSEAQKLFISYSHEDEDFRLEVEKCLARLERQGEVRTWHDRKIGAGEEWRGQIDAELEASATGNGSTTPSTSNPVASISIPFIQSEGEEQDDYPHNSRKSRKSSRQECS